MDGNEICLFFKNSGFSYAIARILDEAVESSYRNGGRHASITVANITKETVMNKIHSLQFPPVDKPNGRSSEIINRRNCGGKNAVIFGII